MAQISAGELDGLLTRLAAGDRTTEVALYNAVRVPVYAYALSLLKRHTDAEDVVHDCFLQICEAAPTYRSQGKPMAWVLTIAKHLCFARLRQAAPLAEELSDDALPAPSLDADDRVVLTAVLSALTEEERQIVVSHTIAGLKHREIAALLGLPLSTVLSKYRRALQKLRAALS